jgi:predicted nicotinamide N-methyase
MQIQQQTHPEYNGRAGWPTEGAVRLHNVMFGYLSSKALFSALELGVFDELEIEPNTEDELAGRLGLPERSTRLLMLALLGSGLVELDGDVYRNSSDVAPFLISDSPEYVGSLAAHQAAHFGRFGQLTEALRQNAPVPTDLAGDHPAFGGPERFARITRTAAKMMMARGLAWYAPLQSRRRLIDLGCGSCVYSIALAKAHPDLQVTAVDRPSLRQFATASVAEAGLSGRITVEAGDIFVDTFEAGEVALLSNVAEGYDADRAAKLVKHVYEWLPDGGELLIHSHMWEQAETPFPYTIGLILLVNNGQGGEPYSATVTREWMEAAGFREVHPAVAVSPISAVVRAVK